MWQWWMLGIGERQADKHLNEWKRLLTQREELWFRLKPQRK